MKFLITNIIDIFEKKNVKIIILYIYKFLIWNGKKYLCIPIINSKTSSVRSIKLFSLGAKIAVRSSFSKSGRRFSDCLGPTVLLGPTPSSDSLTTSSCCLHSLNKLALSAIEKNFQSTCRRGRRCVYSRLA